MQNYAVGESKCEDDEENVSDQNVNAGSNVSVLTQKFEKANKIDDSGISKDLNVDVAGSVPGRSIDRNFIIKLLLHLSLQRLMLIKRHLQ